MGSERRQHSRSDSAGLVYAQFDEENLGIVLNASMGGICFQTVAPTRGSRLIKLKVSPSGKGAIGVSGKIVWIDNSGKMGGLKFVDPTAEASARLKDWLSSQEASEELKFAEIHESESWKRSGISEATPVPRAAAEGPAFELPASHRSSPTGPRMFASFADSVETPEIADFGAIQKPRYRILHGLATGIIVAVLLLMPILYIFNFHPQIAFSLIDRVRSIFPGTDPGTDVPQQAEEPQQTAAQKTTPQQTQSRQTEPREIAPVPAIANNAAGESGAGTNREVGVEPGPVPNRAGRTSATAETSPLRPPVVHRSAPQRERFPRAAPPRLPVDINDPNELWAAIGQGDTDAEVALARLYLAGHNVSKNCKQARVLLTAAAKKNNPDAIRELSQLLREGCR